MVGHAFCVGPELVANFESDLLTQGSLEKFVRTKSHCYVGCSFIQGSRGLSEGRTTSANDGRFEEKTGVVCVRVGCCVGRYGGSSPSLGRRLSLSFVRLNAVSIGRFRKDG